MYIFKRLTILIAILLFSSASVSDQRSDIDVFVNSFMEALSGNDIASIVAMNEWDGLSEQQRKSIELSYTDIAVKGVVSFRVDNIDDGESISFEKKGNVFSPNLIPLAQLFIDVNVNKDFRGGYSFYIGKDNGIFKFSHVVLKNP